MHHTPCSTLFPYTTLFRSSFAQIATCSSSLRYKMNVKPFSDGLSVVDRLQPITFDWRDDGMQTIAERLYIHFVAQDRKSTRLNSSHVKISYAVFCLKKKNK